MRKIFCFLKSCHLHFNWAITILAVAVLLKLGFDITHIRQNQTTQLIKQERTFQFFYSSFNMDLIKQRYVLFMRDKIIERWENLKKYNPKISIDHEKAYRIAEINYREHMKYPYLKDPLFLLALQRIESNFGVDSISPMGAKGLNQVMEYTAKLVCPLVGLTYSDSLLFDLDANTRIAAKVLEVLYSVYPDYELILVGYNGGGKQIYYYKKANDSLALETKIYIPNVLAQWKIYEKEFPFYKADSLAIKDIMNN